MCYNQLGLTRGVLLVLIIQISVGLLFTILSFLTLIGTKYTNEKFIQLELPNYFRFVTGIVQLIGGITMLLGIIFPIILNIAGIWVFMIMLVAVILRIRSNDSFVSTIPAIMIGLLSILILIVR